MDLEVVRPGADKLLEARVLRLDLDDHLVEVDKVHALLDALAIDFAALEAAIASEEAGHEGQICARPTDADVSVLPDRDRCARRCRIAAPTCAATRLTHAMPRAASAMLGMTSTKRTRPCHTVQTMPTSTV